MVGDHGWDVVRRGSNMTRTRLLATSLIFDVIRMASGSESLGVASYWMIAAGVVGGLVAAVFGLVDWLAIPRNTRAWRIGALHGGGNVVVVVLFAVSWFLRGSDPAHAGSGPFAVSLIAVLLALVTGWLGGELVDRLGVGVYSGEHLDSPSSLGHRPATEHWTPARTLHPRKA